MNTKSRYLATPNTLKEIILPEHKSYSSTLALIVTFMSRQLNNLNILQFILEVQNSSMFLLFEAIKNPVLGVSSCH